PAVAADIQAANVNGQRTSKLPIELGLSILADVIKALGGNIGVTAKFEKARTLEFTFENVLKDRANLISIGDYLTSGAVKWRHVILEKYLFGAGNLYVITETL